MLDRNSISHPALRGLYDHWRGLAPAGTVPPWRGFDPLAVAPCIGWILVAEIDHEPFRVRYRLVGERLTGLYGRDLTGRDVDRLYMPDFRARLLNDYAEVATTGEARYAVMKFHALPGKFDYQRLMLPFCRRESAVDIVLVGIFPVDPQFRADDWRHDSAVREMVRQLAAIEG